MSRPLGRKQRDAMVAICRPGSWMVVPDKITRSLCARGLAIECAPDAFVHITSKGLRLVADEMDAGRISNGSNLDEALRKSKERPLPDYKPQK